MCGLFSAWTEHIVLEHTLLKKSADPVSADNLPGTLRKVSLGFRSFLAI